MGRLFPARTIGSYLWPSLLAVLLTVTGMPIAQARTHTATSLTFVDGAGSTFITPLMSRWTADYTRSVDPAVRIRYQSIGSGDGIQLFLFHAVDFGASDAFLSNSTMQAAGNDVLHIPLTLAPESIIYNLPALKSPLRLDGATLAEIYLGQITRWNDAALTVLNPGLSLPNLPITVIHRVDGSGTTFIFTSYLSAVSAEWAASVGSGIEVNWPHGNTGRGNGGVAAAVKQTPGSIGYVSLAYATSGQISTAMIQNRDGQYVLPSVAGALADAAGATQLPPDLRAEIVNAPGPASYPISGYSWALIHQHAPDDTTYPAMLGFLWWCVHDGQRLANLGNLGYAPLPAPVVKREEVLLRSVTYQGKPLLNQ